MAKPVALVAAVLTACVLPGCIPISYTVGPGVDARIVDAVTGEAVQGARVSVINPRDPDAPARAAVSGADGHVLLPAVKQVIVWIIPSDIFPTVATMSIDAPGYEPYEGEAHERGLGRREPAPGPLIKLTPKSGS